VVRDLEPLGGELLQLPCGQQEIAGAADVHRDGEPEVQLACDLGPGQVRPRPVIGHEAEREIVPEPAVLRVAIAGGGDAGPGHGADGGRDEGGDEGDEDGELAGGQGAPRPGGAHG